MMKKPWRWIFGAVPMVVGLWGLPLTGVAAERDPACPADARDLPIEALYGAWQARIEGEPDAALLRLHKHPEYAGVRGTLVRGGAAAQSPAAQVAGDIDDEGLLSLDESADGRSISGVWLGRLQPGSCGRAFEGVWRNAEEDSTHPFTLNKLDR